jgi:hypothetical protein
VKKFNTDNTYILEKEADCIHKIWLNLNISDLKIEYPKSTYKYIKDLCAKYNITYTASKQDTDIVTFDEYINDIIPLFLANIDTNVTLNNNYIIYKQSLLKLKYVYLNKNYLTFDQKANMKQKNKLFKLTY